MAKKRNDKGGLMMGVSNPNNRAAYEAAGIPVRGHHVADQSSDNNNKKKKQASTTNTVYKPNTRNN